MELKCSRRRGTRKQPNVTVNRNSGEWEKVFEGLLEPNLKVAMQPEKHPVAKIDDFERRSLRQLARTTFDLLLLQSGPTP